MKSKVLLCLLAALCACSLKAQAQQKTQTAILRGQNNGQHFRLELTSGPFRRQNHKLEWRTRWIDVGSGKREPQKTAYIDGKPEWDLRGRKNWWGTDGGFPYTEIHDLTLRVNGRDWNIPHKLYADCYEPNTFSPVGGRPHWWAWITKDGSRVTLKMHASDGAGSYQVRWDLQRNGKHTRLVAYPP